MKFYEYQTKDLFRNYGIRVPKGELIRKLEDIDTALSAVGTPPVVVKAQVLAGGRGKAGGIQFAESSNDIQRISKDLLGKELTTFQTAGQGETIRTLYLEEKSTIAASFYLGMVVDREQQAVVIIASAEGGVEIEEVAANHPEKIITEAIPSTGYLPYMGRQVACKLGLTGRLIGDFASMTGKLYKLFVERDASLLEINPLVRTDNNQLIALDGKFAMDENAAYRQKALVDLYTADNSAAEDSNERSAKEIGVNYVSLDGNIGCMVNGAGLAMATMDMIKLFGGEPANFLDVGGSASKEQVRDAFKLLTSHAKVQGILVNIFGGIVHCDRVASGIVAATRELGLKVPVVVRLEGTRIEEGKKILKESGLDLTAADNLEAGAKLIVEKVGG